MQENYNVTTATVTKTARNRTVVNFAAPVSLSSIDGPSKGPYNLPVKRPEKCTGKPGGSQLVSSAVFASSNSPLSRPILDKSSGASSRERPECAFPVEVNMGSRQTGRPNTGARAKVLETDPGDHMDEASEGTADYSDLAAIRRELDNLRQELATLKVSGTITSGNSAARQLPVHMELGAMEKH
ncbi:hypothetical protein M513_13276, partial [Trichuris suis]